MRSIPCLLSVVMLVALMQPTPAHAEHHEKTVKVFILAGQSNMEGHGKVEMGRDPKYDPKSKDHNKREIKGGLGSLRYLATNPETAPKYKHLLNADGTWVVRDDVWCYATIGKHEKGKLTTGFGKGPWFGPEFAFGHVLGDHVKEPVLIIKTAWGGHDLGVKFRPPSSGKPAYEKTKFKAEDVGSSYREMVKVIKDVRDNLGTHFPELKGHKIEFAGFGWHQGWNDAGSAEMVNEYARNFSNLIRDLRKEIDAPNMPVVIANTGMIGRGGKGIRAQLCEIQLDMADPKKHPEFKGTIAAVETRDFDRTVEQSPSHFGYHWKHNAESHWLVGEAMGKAMVGLLKKAK